MKTLNTGAALKNGIRKLISVSYRKYPDRQFLSSDEIEYLRHNGVKSEAIFAKALKILPVITIKKPEWDNIYLSFDDICRRCKSKTGTKFKMEYAESVQEFNEIFNSNFSYIPRYAQFPLFYMLTGPMTIDPIEYLLYRDNFPDIWTDTSSAYDLLLNVPAVLDRAYGKNGALIKNEYPDFPFDIEIKVKTIKPRLTPSISVTITPKRIYTPRPVEKFLEEFKADADGTVKDLQLIREWLEYYDVIEPVKTGGDFSSLKFKLIDNAVSKRNIDAATNKIFTGLIDISHFNEDLMKLLLPEGLVPSNSKFHDNALRLKAYPALKDPKAIFNVLDSKISTVEEVLTNVKLLRKTMETLYNLGEGQKESQRISYALKKLLYKRFIDDPLSITTLATDRDGAAYEYLKELAKKSMI